MTIPQLARSRVSVLDVPVDLLPRTGVESWLQSVMTSGNDPRCRHLVTLNPEYVMAADRDDDFRKALREADLAVPDGVGITLAMRWLRRRRSSDGPFDRVTGVDVTEIVAAIGAANRVPVFLLGAGPGVAAVAAGRLSARHPGFVLAGTWGGGTASPSDDAQALALIRASGAVVVLVAYGAPGQIHWIARNQEVLAASGVRLAIGVGGALDFIAGTVRRAPAWVRRAGFEWLYRLLREPWRWRRQLVLPRFALRVAMAGVRQRLGARRSASPGV
ncbi:MAG TPA: WecB/TagA/CpsF family glycosyltransferase [Thermomicrobiales bacterium]|nr:WecB/TagA/CpsF family glycosyltransferase [Thermomicrobiales bacterium]